MQLRNEGGLAFEITLDIDARSVSVRVNHSWALESAPGELPLRPLVVATRAGYPPTYHPHLAVGGYPRYVSGPSKQGDRTKGEII